MNIGQVEIEGEIALKDSLGSDAQILRESIHTFWCRVKHVEFGMKNATT